MFNILANENKKNKNIIVKGWFVKECFDFATSLYILTVLFWERMDLVFCQGRVDAIS